MASSSGGSAAANAHKGRVPRVNGIIFAEGTRVEAQDYLLTWYAARIIEVDYANKQALIHFDRWSKKFDEWIPFHSEKLRPFLAFESVEGLVCDVESEEVRVGDVVAYCWWDGNYYPCVVIVRSKTQDGSAYIVRVRFGDEHRTIISNVKVQDLLTGKKAAKALQGLTSLVPPTVPMYINPPLTAAKALGKGKAEAPPSTGSDGASSSEGAHNTADLPAAAWGPLRAQPEDPAHAEVRSDESTARQSRADKLIAHALLAAKLYCAEHVFSVPSAAGAAASAGAGTPVDACASPSTEEGGPAASNKRPSTSIYAKQRPALRSPDAASSSSTPTRALDVSVLGAQALGTPASPFVATPASGQESDHNEFRCKEPNCGKSFRKEKMLQSHIKFYHADPLQGGAVSYAAPSPGGSALSERKKSTEKKDSSESLHVGEGGASKRPSTPSITVAEPAAKSSRKAGVSTVKKQKSTVTVDAKASASAWGGESDGEGEADSDGDTRCICGCTEEQSFMIQCERCHAWQHGECVGIRRDNVPKHYLCNGCLPSLTAIKSQSKYPPWPVRHDALAAQPLKGGAGGAGGSSKGVTNAGKSELVKGKVLELYQMIAGDLVCVQRALHATRLAINKITRNMSQLSMDVLRSLVQEQDRLEHSMDAMHNDLQALQHNTLHISTTPDTLHHNTSALFLNLVHKYDARRTVAAAASYVEPPLLSSLAALAGVDDDAFGGLGAGLMGDVGGVGQMGAVEASMAAGAAGSEVSVPIPVTMPMQGQQMQMSAQVDGLGQGTVQGQAAVGAAVAQVGDGGNSGGEVEGNALLSLVVGTDEVMGGVL